MRIPVSSTQPIPPMPPLGDERKKYAIVLSEPEVNALYGVIAFAESACHPPATAVPLYGGQRVALDVWALEEIAALDPTQYIDLADLGITAQLQIWWEHYGPTLKALDKRLQVFDDSKLPAKVAQ